MIDDKHLDEICKMGEGADCCAFLIVGPGGISCAKDTVFVPVIKGRIDTMVAQGDNCPGYGADPEPEEVA